MKMTVSAAALLQVLNALGGEGHLIRELQATRGPLFDNPIDTLVAEYNEQVLAPPAHATAAPADAARLEIAVGATDRGTTIVIVQPHADGSRTVIYSGGHPMGDTLGIAHTVARPDFNGFDISKLPPILISCVAKLWPGSSGMFWEAALERMPARIEQLMAQRAPGVEQCITEALARHPMSDRVGTTQAAQLRYFEDVHQHLAPLARALESENHYLKAENQRLWAERKTK